MVKRQRIMVYILELYSIEYIGGNYFWLWEIG